MDYVVSVQLMAPRLFGTAAEDIHINNSTVNMDKYSLCRDRPSRQMAQRRRQQWHTSPT